MLAVRTPEVSRPTRHGAVSGCCLPRREIGSAASITFDFAALPCGSGLTIRSLALRPGTSLSTLRRACYQTPRKTQYAAARLRLCRDRHLRRLNSTHLQGATLPKPDMTLSVSSGFPVPLDGRIASVSCHCGYLRIRPSSTCGPSPCERLSRPRTTTAAPSP
jgi:hypothetical protein